MYWSEVNHKNETLGNPLILCELGTQDNGRKVKFYWP